MATPAFKSKDSAISVTAFQQFAFILFVIIATTHLNKPLPCPLELQILFVAATYSDLIIIDIRIKHKKCFTLYYKKT